MGRGIEAGQIFRTKKDREDFIDRLTELRRSGSWSVYAWAFMPNHFHLLVRTGKEPLSRSMRRLMTGYAINFININEILNGIILRTRSMPNFSKSKVVLVKYPFSDLSNSKVRPAVIVGTQEDSKLFIIAAMGFGSLLKSGS